MDIATISVLVIIIGCVFLLVEWIRTVKNDASLFAAQVHTLETQVIRLQEELLELKKDEKATEAIVQKALEEKIMNEKVLAILQEHCNITSDTE